MTDNERIDYLIGQVAVLKAFAISTGVVSPRPSELLQAFDRSAETIVAKLLPTSASESMLNGIASMRTEIGTVLSRECIRRDDTFGQSKD